MRCSTPPAAATLPRASRTRTTRSFYKLRGVIANLDTTAKTFTMGGEVISYAGLTLAELPNVLANGQRVRVRLQTTQVAGQWVAVALRPGVRKLEDRDEAHLRGAITALTFDRGLRGQRPAGRCRPARASPTARPAWCSAPGRGRGPGGERRAGGHQGGAGRSAMRMSVTASNCTAPSARWTRPPSTFTLRGVRVSYGAGTTFRDGSAGRPGRWPPGRGQGHALGRPHGDCRPPGSTSRTDAASDEPPRH